MKTNVSESTMMTWKNDDKKILKVNIRQIHTFAMLCFLIKCWFIFIFYFEIPGIYRIEYYSMWKPIFTQENVKLQYLGHRIEFKVPIRWHIGLYNIWSSHICLLLSDYVPTYPFLELFDNRMQQVLF